MTLPREFIIEMEEILKGGVSSFIDAENQPPALAMHVNPLKIGAGSAAQDFIADAVPWWDGGYYILPATRPGASIRQDLGAYYLQEASAMTAVAALDPRPGERILDLCAAPGGKSFQIAGRMMGEGVLISNEPYPARAKILSENLTRMGVVNAVVTCAFPQHLSERWRETFDAILIDAPCSGEGMFRRDEHAVAEWNPKAKYGCAKRQLEILSHAAKMLRPGGRMVYSSCTFNETENEGVISSFLESHEDFSPEDFFLPVLGKSSSGMMRVWPQNVRGDGHFACRMRKSDGRMRKERRIQHTDGREMIARLASESCALPACLADGRSEVWGQYVHVMPSSVPDLAGISIVKGGLCALRFGRSHVQPTPELGFAASIHDRSRLAKAMRSVELTESE